MRTGDEVDRDCVLVSRHGERGGLTRRFDECDEVRTRDITDVESREDSVRQVDEADAEPLAAGRRNSLDETRSGECPELTRYGARCHARTARHLIRPELSSVRERVEDGDRSFGGADAAGLQGRRGAPCPRRGPVEGVWGNREVPPASTSERIPVEAEI